MHHCTKASAFQENRTENGTTLLNAPPPRIEYAGERSLQKQAGLKTVSVLFTVQGEVP